MSGVVVQASGDGVYAFSVTDIQPSPRFGADDQDVGPWARIRVKEAASRIGPWTDATVIGEAALTPVDSDPADPATREVTVAGANLAAGWYVFELLDDAGNRQPLAPIHNGQSWRPSITAIAAVSPAYTNNERAFDEDTEPTAHDVDGYINAAVQEIAGRAGITDDVLSRYADLARQAAVWHAAASVEGQKAPEGFEGARSAFQWKQSSYVACLNELIAQGRRSPLRMV